MSLAPPKVLLIEDNHELLQLISDMLLRGAAPVFDSIGLTRLEQGLDRLRTGDISAVLLDLGLPDSVGLDSLRRLRREFPELPIVVLTGLQDEQTALEALREGAQDYLLKHEMSSNVVVRALRFA